MRWQEEQPEQVTEASVFPERAFTERSVKSDGHLVTPLLTCLLSSVPSNYFLSQHEKNYMS